MSSLKLKFAGWRELRNQKFISQWELTRARGHTIFTLRTAITWGGLMTLNLLFSDYLHEEQAGTASLYFSSICFLLVALFMAGIEWNINEKRYLKATQRSSQPAPDKVENSAQTPLRLTEAEQDAASEWQRSAKNQEQKELVNNNL